MKHAIPQSNDHHDAQQLVLAAPAAATAAYLWTRTSMLRQVWDLVQAVGEWPDVVIATKPTGLCLTLGGVVLGHLQWNGRIDLPFGPKLRDRLVTERMASRHPDFSETDRVVFDVRSQADVDRALWLLRLAYLSAESNGDVGPTKIARARDICA